MRDLGRVGLQAVDPWLIGEHRLVVVEEPHRRLVVEQVVGLTQQVVALGGVPGLRGKERVPAKSLSYGDRRALEIGVALAAEPGVLCLDEPTSGLGTEGTARLADLIRSLKGTLTLVAIYSAEGLRDAAMNEQLGKAMMGGPMHWMSVKRLRRDAHAPLLSCRFHADRFCITSA